MKYMAIIDSDEKPVSCEFIGCNGNVNPYFIGATTNIKPLEQEQEPKTEWIPVSERLPKHDGWYLISLGEKTYGGADIDMYCKGWVKYGTHVIAWMPLPEPYEESEKNVCKDCHYNDGEVHAECVICDRAESEE